MRRDGNTFAWNRHIHLTQSNFTSISLKSHVYPTNAGEQIDWPSLSSLDNIFDAAV